MRLVSSSKKRTAAVLIAMMLLLGTSLRSYARDYDDHYDRDRGGYVFATTRDVNQMDAPAALRLTLLPVAVILDLVFLPFAALADAMTR